MERLQTICAGGDLRLQNICAGGIFDCKRVANAKDLPRTANQTASCHFTNHKSTEYMEVETFAIPVMIRKVCERAIEKISCFFLGIQEVGTEANKEMRANQRQRANINTSEGTSCSFHSTGRSFCCLLPFYEGNFARGFGA